MTVIDAAEIRGWHFPIVLRRGHFLPGQALVITSVSRTEPFVVIGAYIRDGKLKEEPRPQGLIEGDYKFFHAALSPQQGSAKDLSYCLGLDFRFREEKFLFGRPPHEFPNAIPLTLTDKILLTDLKALLAKKSETDSVKDVRHD